MFRSLTVYHRYFLYENGNTVINYKNGNMKFGMVDTSVHLQKPAGGHFKFWK